MELLILTPAEIAFLSLPPAGTDDLQARLSRRLGALLTARLRLPVRVEAHWDEMDVESAATPCWQPDAALATLWLTRRLGGQPAAGRVSFVPRSLIQNLDACLAECWLDTAAPPRLPAALGWRITTAFTQSGLSVQMPHYPTDMTRWAREIIRHD